MKTLTRIFRPTILVSLAVATAGHAEQPRVDFGFEAALAGKYDSNVALVELDSSAGEADTATALEAAITLTVNLDGGFRLETGYDYSGTRFREFTDFDLDLHHGRVAMGLRRRGFDSAVAVDRFAGLLDGEGYLVQTQVSPSIARLFGRRWYLRAAYTRADKSFDQAAERGATADAVRLDAYLLIDGMDHYLAAAATRTSEEALDSAFDFDSVSGQLTWGYRIAMPRTELRLRAQLRYEQRAYTALLREDDRMRAGLTLTVPLSQHVSIGASVDHTRNESDADAVSLDRTVYAMEFGVAF